MLYSGRTEDSRVEKFDSGGNYLTQWGSFGSGNGQFELVLRHGGGQQEQRVCGGHEKDRVEKFDDSGNYLTQWGSAGSGNGQFDLSLWHCGGQHGELYIRG